MKTAVTSKGNNLDSCIDPRFGRCAYFAVYDSETDGVTFLDNPAKDSESGAGPAAVAFIARQGVKRIVSGEFGMKIKGILDDLKIEMVSEKDEKSINEIINSFK